MGCIYILFILFNFIKEETGTYKFTQARFQPAKNSSKPKRITFCLFTFFYKPSIFRFNNGQTNKVQGLSPSKKAVRRRRNQVSMKYNLINWIMETICTLLVVIDSNR